MATMIKITCKCGCGQKKEVRTTDVKRGWGLFFSKSCKAKFQERRTGQFRDFQERQNELFEGGIHPCGCVSMESGWEGHGQS